MGLAEDLAKIQAKNSAQAKLQEEIDKGVKYFIDRLKDQVGYTQERSIHGYWAARGYFGYLDHPYYEVEDVLRSHPDTLYTQDFRDGMTEIYTGEQELLEIMYHGPSGAKGHQIGEGDRIAVCRIFPKFLALDLEVAKGIQATLLREHAANFKRFDIQLFESYYYKEAELRVVEVLARPRSEGLLFIDARKGTYKLQLLGTEMVNYYYFGVDIEW